MGLFRPRQEQRSSYSISDPAFAEWMSTGNINYSGVLVTENSALALSAFYRAVSLISGTIASLPMRTLRDGDDGTRQQVPSFLDNPGGLGGPTPFEWKETVLAHLILHGNAYLVHLHNGAGSVAGLMPVHPLSVSIQLDVNAPGGRVYQVTLNDGSRREYTMMDLTHIPAMSLDGVYGLSLIGVARNSFGTSIAGDRASARMFSNGALVSGMVTPEEDVTEAEAKLIKESLNARMAGIENAGDIAVINRKLKFTQWTQTHADAQFLESRQFQVEEVSRWTGVPPFALMQTDKQTSWGTGIESQQRGLARTVLAPWTARIEQRLSQLLPSPRFVEFDFAGLERGTPEQEIGLLIQQVNAGLLTPNEARRIRNLPPVEGGDVLRASVLTQPVGEEVDA